MPVIRCLPLTDKNLELLAAAIWATVSGGDNLLWEKNEEAIRWLRTVCTALSSADE